MFHGLRQNFTVSLAERCSEEEKKDYLWLIPAGVCALPRGKGYNEEINGIMGSGSRPLGTRSSSRPRLRKLLAGLIPRVYSFCNMAAAKAFNSRNTCIAQPLEARGRQRSIKCQRWKDEENWSKLCGLGGRVSTLALVYWKVRGSQSTGHCFIDKLPNHTDSPRSNGVFC